MTSTTYKRTLSGLTGAQLRAIRDLLGLTQAELGARLGISKTEIYRKESWPDGPAARPIQRVQVDALRWFLYEAGHSDHQIARLTKGA